MPGYIWSDEEKCLIIWFASIGVAQATIVLLLEERGFSRTLGGVQNKISEIRKEFSLGNASHQLVEIEVDRWIDGLSTRIDTDELLKPTLRDQYILDKVFLD
jgi:hypothetical protein